MVCLLVPLIGKVLRSGARCQWDSSSSNRPFESQREEKGEQQSMILNEIGICNLLPSYDLKVSRVYLRQMGFFMDLLKELCQEPLWRLQRCDGHVDGWRYGGYGVRPS